MKKRLKKVLALGMAVAMLAGAPLPAMAAEAAPADAAVTAEAQPADAAVETQPVDEAMTAETQPEIAMQAADEDAAGTALPNGVDPLTLDGLVQLNDGNWYYMQNCRVSGAANKTVKPACGSWWYVGGCRVDFSYTGFGRNGADNWYVQNGQVQFGYTGIVTAKDETNRTYVCYVTNGRLDTDYTGLAYGTVDGVEGWYNFHDGYNFHEGYLNKGKELVEYNGAWWYVSDERKVDFSYTGIAYNEAGGWYVRNGQVDFSYNGILEYEVIDGPFLIPYQYHFVNGKLNEGLTGLYYTTVNGKTNWYGFQNGAIATFEEYEDSYGTLFLNESGWWYVDPIHGTVDFSYTGLGKTVFPGDDRYHYWYVKNGRIDFNYNGFLELYGGVYYVKNGQVDETVNGVYQYTVNGKTDWHGLWRGKKAYNEVLMNPNDGSWWYVRDGLVDFSYTGMGTRHDWTGDTSDTWYIRNGQVDFSYSGCVAADGNTRYLRRYYLVENGRLRKEVSGLVQATVEGVNGWWKIDQGVITVQSGGSETFLVYYNGDWWYVLNSGQVDFSFTGLKGYNGETWYVENGRVNFDKTGFVNLSGDATTRYTYIQNGHPLPYGFSGLFYAELDGKTTWWQIEEGHCDYYGGPEPSHYERPQSFAANEEGLWATNNSQISYGITGVYKSMGRMGYSTYSIEVEYTYNVVNGLVTEMQAVIL